MTVEIEKIVARIEADTRQLRSEIERSKRQLGDFGGSVQDAFKRAMQSAQGFARELVSVRSALVLAAGTTGLFMAINRSIEFGDQLAKTADRIGVTIEGLQELRFAAGRAGVEVGELDNSLLAFTRRIGAALQGATEQVEGFQQLGITLADLRQQNPEELLRRVADGFAALESPTLRAELAQRLFGRSGLTLINMLKGGRAEIDQMAEIAQRYGIVISEKVARETELANDELGDMVQILKMAAVRLSLEFMPVLRQLVNTFLDSNFQQGVKSVMGTIESSLKFLVENADSIKTVIGALVGLSIGARLGPKGAIAGAAIGGLLPSTRLLESELEAVDRQIAQLEVNLKNLWTRFNEGGRNVFGDLLPIGESLLDQINRITGELEQLLMKRAGLVAQTPTAPRTPATGTPPATVPALPPSTGGGVDRVAELRRDLQFELDQLRRTEEEQLLYNLAKQAGVEVTAQFRAQVESLALALKRETEQAEAIKAAQAAAIQQKQELREQGQRLIETTRTAEETYRATVMQLDELAEQLRVIGELTPEVEEALRRAGAQARKTFEEARKEGDRGRDAMRELGATFESAFESAIVRGEKLRDVLSGIGQDLLRLFVRRAITAPLFGILEEAGSSLLPGLFSAKGNVFQNQRVTPFARGGVVSGPVAFPLARGIGIAGEAGAEGILPLRRNQRGQLGVMAQGTGGATQVVINNYTGAQVSETRDRIGNLERVFIMIGDKVASQVRQPGTQLHRAIRDTFGARVQPSGATL